MTDNSALGEFILFILNKEKNESLQAKGIYLDYSINRENYIDYKLLEPLIQRFIHQRNLS